MYYILKSHTKPIYELREIFREKHWVVKILHGS